MALAEDLQDLIDAECAKKNTHALILRGQSADGQVDFRGGAGASTPDTRFPVASISKMFTATLIMQLADEGRIDLDQSVQSLLTDIDLTGLHVVKGVNYEADLTVRHLLHQTSGLADYYESDLAADLKEGNDRSYDLDDVLRMTKALPPQAAPDSGKSHYSDTNYQLLGAVIEAATGRTYDHALQGRICEPLGLKQTAVLQGADVGLPIYHETRVLNVPRILTSMGPDGGIISTMDEIGRAHVELQSLRRISYAVFCLKKKKNIEKCPAILAVCTDTADQRRQVYDHIGSVIVEHTAQGIRLTKVVFLYTGSDNSSRTSQF